MSASTAVPVRSTPSSARTARGSRPSSGSQVGFVDPDLGTVQIGGQPLRRDSPAQARKLGLAMAYQDTSLILAEPVKNNLFLAAPPDQRPPYWRRKKWARQSSPSSTSTSSCSPTPRRGPSACRPPALRGGEGARDRPAGAAPRRAHHGLGTGRGRGAAPDRRRVQAARRRRGVRQPSSAGGPRDRRSHHRPARRSEPGHVRREGDDRGRARRVDRRPPLRGRLPAVRPRGG